MRRVWFVHKGVNRLGGQHISKYLIVREMGFNYWLCSWDMLNRFLRKTLWRNYLWFPVNVVSEIQMTHLYYEEAKICWALAWLMFIELRRPELLDNCKLWNGKTWIISGLQLNRSCKIPVPREVLHTAASPVIKDRREINLHLALIVMGYWEPEVAKPFI